MIKCEVCGKDITNLTINCANNMKLCCKHYQQRIKYGKFLDNSQYSIADKNEFYVENNCAYIILKNSKGNRVGEALIDLEDLDRTIVKKWRFWKGIVFTGNYKPISLQYFILNENPINNQLEKVIDHINGNPMDNRKSNLRVITQRENSLNKKILSNNTSSICGVWFDNLRKKWCAEIKLDKKKCYLGRYNNKNEAVYARYVGENLLFNDYRSFRNDSIIYKEIQNCQNKEYIKSYVEHRLKDIYKL